MRIGVDLRCLASGRRSGVEEYAVSLLSSLFRIDTEDEFVLFLNEWRNEKIDLTWAEGFPNVTILRFRIPNKLLNLSLWYFRYPKLDRLVGGADIFFMPNINFCAVSGKTRLFVTAHDLSFELCPGTFSLKQRIWHFLVDSNRLFRRAHHVFAVSKSTRDDLISRYGILKDRITVISSGVDKRFREYDRNDPKMLSVQERYDLPFRFILYLGAFEPRKNIESLVHAFETLKRARHPKLEKLTLVLAGVSGWKEEGIRKTIEHSPFGGNIMMPGFVDDADKAVFYNLASVFVYPSFYEGFGFPALEALACGTPVIASNSSSLPEVVGDAGMMIDPHRPDEIFRALEAVLLDRKLADCLSKKGTERAKRFSWDTAARRVRESFSSVNPSGRR
ncbi:MAG: glycosyltransferase family 4 protein [Candidatus Moranbacteria bacterium]|nr:glycosyltransferase family 4 protein [Candidatus Moranbacteria bacterium]